MQPRSVLAKSCAACRRRKIKCDRGTPACAYCTKLSLNCEYPTRRSHDASARRGDVEPATSEGSSKPNGIHSRTSEQEVNPAQVHQPFWARIRNEAAMHNSPQSDPGSIEKDTASALALSIDQDSLGPALRPSLAEVLRLWQLFVDNVDPLIKIVHTPSIQARILEVGHPSSPSFDALLSAIFYAANISVQDRQVEDVGKYRHNVQQALVSAHFAESYELETLQAFVLYLLCVRFDTQGPSAWTLLSLAVRIGMRMGLHQKGPGDVPFEDELRRRLWWQICILDIRTAEDEGTEPFIPEHHLKVPLPTNISDLDIYPEMSRKPTASRLGTTMFYNNLRIDVSLHLRPILFRDTAMCADLLRKKMQEVDSLQQRLDDEYFSQCDLQIPICGFAVATVKLVLAKSRLGLYISAGPVSDEVEDRIFTTSVEILEQTQMLTSHRPFLRWWWLVRTYVEWDALVLVLRGLCRNPDQFSADRAWTAIDTAFGLAGQVSQSTSHRGRWECLCRLRERAETGRRRSVDTQHITPSFTCTSEMLPSTSAMIMPDLAQAWTCSLPDGGVSSSWFNDEQVRAIFDGYGTEMGLPR